MRTIYKIFLESIRQALGQLSGNRLRSFLSLLGISIGIFCVIGVFSGVESLQSYIKENLEQLGDDIVYVQKWPFAEPNLKWWVIMKRPHPDYEDYKVIKERVKNAALTAYYTVIGLKTIKYESSYAERVAIVAASEEASDIFKFEFEKGRYYSPSEVQSGANKVVLGYDVAESLFGDLEPVGKKVKLMGRRYEVIGVLTKVGDDDFDPLDYDEAAILMYNNAKNLVNLKSRYSFDGTVAVKSREGVSLDYLSDEIRGVLRTHRRLRPREKDNFAINELAMILSVVDDFFGTLNALGFFIGIFAMLVGGVSVANIMFVSVKERTNLIGVKKAIGAKQYMILLEFLLEAVLLCIIGGLIGLGMVYLLASIMSVAIDFNLFLSLKNIMIGVGFSIFVGVVSGFVPALQASRLDPVVAMRQ